MPDEPEPGTEPSIPVAPVTGDKPEPETVTLPKAEIDALRRQAAEAAKAKRKAEADAKAAEEQRQQEQGQYKELAEQREREAARLREENARILREQRVVRIATRMKFLDPADVMGRVSPEDGEDDTLTEAALERIAKASPHLIAKESGSKPEIGQVLAPSAAAAAAAAADGTPKPPPGKAPLTSREDLQKLSEVEVNERWEEVSALLERLG